MPPKNANSASENAQKIQSEKQDDSQQQTPQEEEIEDIAAEDAQDNDQQQTQDEENANISPETPAASDSSSDAGQKFRDERLARWKKEDGDHLGQFITHGGKR